MFNQTAKTKGKTAKPLQFPGLKRKASKTTPAHGRGFGGGHSPEGTQDEELTETPDQEQAEELTGAEAAESGVQEGNEEEGPQTPCNIEDEPSIASAIQHIQAKRKKLGKPKKYNLGTNTYD